MSFLNAELHKLLAVLLPGILPDAGADAHIPEKNLLFQALFESTAVSKCLLQPDGGLYAANSAMCTYLGYTAEEMAQENIASITHPEDRLLMTDHLEMMAVGGLDSFKLEKRFVNKHGGSLSACVYVTALYDSNQKYQGALAEVQDLTQQKADEEAFQAEHQRLKLAEHLARMGTFEIDLKTSRTTWSEEIINMIGLSEEGYDLQFELGLLNVHNDDRERVRQVFQDAIDQGEEFRVEFRIRHRQEGFLPHLLHGRVLLDEAGERLKVVGYLLNVSAFKQGELKLLATNQQLLEQNRQLTKLAAIVSDDLTGTLGGIQAISAHEAGLGNTHHVLPVLADSVSGLESIDVASQKLQQVRRLEHERRKLSLEAVCSRVLQMLEADIHQSRVRVSLDFSAWSEVETIPAYLETVLLNLLSHALDSTFHPQAREKEIRIRSEFQADAGKELVVSFPTSVPTETPDARLELVKTLLIASGGRFCTEPLAYGGYCFRLGF